jgi:hypothetical protein
MPLSPSFPDWLLKRDPTLAGALTNPLFLAFEGRRVQQGRGLSRLVRHPITVLRPHYQSISAIIAVLALVYFGCVSFCIVAVVLGVGWTHLGGLLPRHREDMVLPSSLTEVIGGRVYLPILRDIWACPATSKEFLEALVLESRRGVAFWSVVKATGLNIFCMLAYVDGASSKRFLVPLDWIDAVVALGFVVLIHPIAGAFYWSDSMRRAEDVKAHLVLLVRGDADARNTIVRTHIGRAVHLVFLLIGASFLYALALPNSTHAAYAGALISMGLIWFFGRVIGEGNKEEYIRQLEDWARIRTIWVDRLRDVTLEGRPFDAKFPDVG